jgi:hypothetical protein
VPLVAIFLVRAALMLQSLRSCCAGTGIGWLTIGVGCPSALSAQLGDLRRLLVTHHAARSRGVRIFVALSGLNVGFDPDGATKVSAALQTPADAGPSPWPKAGTSKPVAAAQRRIAAHNEEYDERNIWQQSGYGAAALSVTSVPWNLSAVDRDRRGHARDAR